MPTEKNSSYPILERLMHLHPKIIDLSLERVLRLLEILGNPQNTLPKVIHIAGTNGKGSTLAMIYAGLKGVGLRANVYTSPHLVRFHERINLNGCFINESHLIELLTECEIKNANAPITYFEITTCMAFLAFSRTQVDYTLLETGLGGRLDATNIITNPAMTIITPISLDHTAYLGDTIEQIAFEKAGILKRNTFCVVGKQEPQVLEIINQQAIKVGATLKIYNQHWYADQKEGRLIFQDEYGSLNLPFPVLIGNHQIDNATMAIAALRLMAIPDAACKAALLNPIWPARMQKLHQGPLVEIAKNNEIWLDGGHNPAAATALYTTLSKMPQRRLYIILGMLNSKDINGYLQPLCDICTRLYAVPISNKAAALAPNMISSAATSIGYHAEAVKDIKTAVKAIVKIDTNARILISGSLYLAGQILKNHF